MTIWNFGSSNSNSVDTLQTQTYTDLLSVAAPSSESVFLAVPLW